MLAWRRLPFGSAVLKDIPDKGVASFFAISVGFDGGAAAGCGPGVGASSWLRLLKILIRAVLPSTNRFTVDRFHVLRWLNAKVQAAMDRGFLRLLSVTIFSMFNDVFGYPRARLPAGDATRNFHHLKLNFKLSTVGSRSRLLGTAISWSNHDCLRTLT
jgi:hypothetical protein